MKLTSFLLSPLTGTVLLTLAAVPTLWAQTTVIVDPSPTAAPVQTTTVQTTTVQTLPAVTPLPGQHVAEIEIVVSHGSVQAYFGQAARGEKIDLGGLKLNVKLPSTATVTKLANRDKDSDGSKRVTVDNPWHVSVPFDGPGRFVFNIVEWDDDPVVVSAFVKVDGMVIFSGRGSEDDFNGWAQKSYGPEVHKTGSREVAFFVGGAH